MFLKKHYQIYRNNNKLFEVEITFWALIIIVEIFST